MKFFIGLLLLWPLSLHAQTLQNCYLKPSYKVVLEGELFCSSDYFQQQFLTKLIQYPSKALFKDKASSGALFYLGGDKQILVVLSSKNIFNKKGEFVTEAFQNLRLRFLMTEEDQEAVVINPLLILNDFERPIYILQGEFFVLNSEGYPQSLYNRLPNKNWHLLFLPYGHIEDFLFSLHKVEIVWDFEDETQSKKIILPNEKFQWTKKKQTQDNKVFLEIVDRSVSENKAKKMTVIFYNYKGESFSRLFFI